MKFGVVFSTEYTKFVYNFVSELNSLYSLYNVFISKSDNQISIAQQQINRLPSFQAKYQSEYPTLIKRIELCVFILGLSVW